MIQNIGELGRGGVGIPRNNAIGKSIHLVRWKSFIWRSFDGLVRLLLGMFFFSFPFSLSFFHWFLLPSYLDCSVFLKGWQGWQGWRLSSFVLSKAYSFPQIVILMTIWLILSPIIGSSTLPISLVDCPARSGMPPTLRFAVISASSAGHPGAQGRVDHRQSRARLQAVHL